MKSIRYIAAISIALIAGAIMEMRACGPYGPDNPLHIKMFRACTPEAERQWQDGCRFQDYEKAENCLLWQRLTSPDIPLRDIERLVYDTPMREFIFLKEGHFEDNKFSKWLLSHDEDYEYLMTAKEIEDIRQYINDPWYYPYEGDPEHQTLDRLLEKCSTYQGSRHKSRYALQTARLYFAQKNYQGCIDLWDGGIDKLPQDIVTDMTASYVAGACLRKGDRKRAIELYTRSQDIGSLMSLKAWADSEAASSFRTPQVRELEYIFHRFPNSPLLLIKLQKLMREKERMTYIAEEWGADRNAYYGEDIDSVSAALYPELMAFARMAASSPRTKDKAVWHYAMAYMHRLNGNRTRSLSSLDMAEQQPGSPLTKESVKALRILTDAEGPADAPEYMSRLEEGVKWLDARMTESMPAGMREDWEYSNKLNWPVEYWQDVTRKALLGGACPALLKARRTVTALQLANYASNRAHQLAPRFVTYMQDDEDARSYRTVITFDEYRNSQSEFNSFDYSNQFFNMIDSISADDAAAYARSIEHQREGFAGFLNERGFTDKDYINEIVGTHYLREMNYAEAKSWLSKVSGSYQARTNLAKMGYLKRDPFRWQDKENLMADNRNYKLDFAKRMLGYERKMYADLDPDREAMYRIRYATGLRNSFGRCWYLTQYGFSNRSSNTDGWSDWAYYTSADREAFAGNRHAQRAYARADRLIENALNSIHDPKIAAQANLELLNFKTVVEKYGSTPAADYVRGHCDKYIDYALHRR